MDLSGVSLIGDQAGSTGQDVFRGINPQTGASLEPAFYPATATELEQATALAQEASPVFAALDGVTRAKLLRRIADGLTEEGAAIVERAHLESGLPLPRLQGELGRTTGQLKLFADVLEEGSWVDARIDEALPERKPLPRSDIRSMLRPLGPVAVFGASNFPLAFSVAGGDTASALAAGNPVIVKAHPAHPGTSEIVGQVIQKAIQESGLPAGIFSLLFDSGIEVGVALVKHPQIKAVAFTGSALGGQALMRLAAARPEPIPCYAEMGSTNPLFILPGALRERGASLAQGLQGSFTLGSGQFCTKPGVVFVPDSGSESFVESLSGGVASLGGHQMLTNGIAAKYGNAIEQRVSEGKAQLLACAQSLPDNGGAVGAPAIFSVSLEQFMQHPELSEEVFGPTTLLVHYGAEKDLLAAATSLHGHLTATIHGTDEDLAQAQELVAVLETKVGRILFNGYPTGVEVCHAMVHGGPFPATSDGRSTSVGTQAMLRFTRPVCYQDFPNEALPGELRRENVSGIMRLVNGNLTRVAQS
ncbi:aldehyde dehydrogenase (NADP(+)) [Granulicella tundricola]|uniref:Aldehyde Dehydrogenase n=1 Tax=Granulicella tundricola (strain ATCC BAA-1859 / DSM 23138 / MP5ACTX9) TaxID=1198114 RepID=E8X6D7_GRATM|nr:aldehyde dehydrogenase (NADP(+)) [Granulicella tundricola]ADW71021.1 Aldehyde Dehydrogenase [Granulicella tundricola MP5ACTX9]